MVESDSSKSDKYRKLAPMLWRCIHRAWLDTWSLLGGWSLVATILIIPFVGFALHYATQGVAAMIGKAQVWMIYGLSRNERGPYCHFSI